MKSILIYDDDEGLRDRLERNLRGLAVLDNVFEICSLDTDTFQASMTLLTERQRMFRDTGTWDRSRTTRLDDADVLVVDYDLFDTDAFLTGETVAYFARCFSSCGLIVGVNQYGHNTFDLTLRGHPESFADLNVGQDQLANPNLWGRAVPGFHPWCWPILPNYLDDFDRKIEDIKASLGTSPTTDVAICEVIGIPSKVLSTVPRSIGQFLGKDPAATTFRQFVAESGNGLRPKDAKPRPVCGDVIARVGAAKVSKWLERLVLPGQDILVDAPHLVSRYPSLLAGDVRHIESWNATARLVPHHPTVLSDAIERFRLSKSHWLSRPVWLWGELRECEEILEVREPWKVKSPGWAFCEDASRFFKGGYGEFVAEGDSPFSRRFVRRYRGIDYRPAYRFSI